MIQSVQFRLRMMLVSAVAGALITGIPATILGQQNPIGGEAIPKPIPRQKFKENVTLPIDPNLPKRLLTAEDLLADQRWSEAIGILQDIAQTESKGLVQVQSGTDGRGIATYLNVATRCQILMSQVSVEGLRSYRQKTDPQAKRWFENWQRTGDESELIRIVRQAFLSSYGDDALNALGEVAWDRADFASARLWWQQLLPLPEGVNARDYPTILRYPDAELDRPAILARIALCSIMERERERAEQEIQFFAQRYPTAEGWLAGKHGRLAERLAQELQESAQWPMIKTTAEVATFALSPSRFQQIPDSLDVGSLRWAHSLPASGLPRPPEGIPFQTEPLSYYPVVDDKIVFVNDQDSIHAWNILSGEPAWPSDRTDPDVIYPGIAEEPSADPEKLCVGVPAYTMTIADGRLYARMGSAVTCATNLSQRHLESDLICLDLNQEGKLLWKIPARNLFSDGTWRFEGTPVVVAGRAYVAVCRRRPQLELMVLCLDALDGRMLWQRSIGGFRTSVDDSQNRVSHLLLTAGGGRIFLNSDAGAIVALDARDGRFEWVISYESRSDESAASLSDPSQKGLMPALFYNGWLIVAPNDSDSAYCIEADSGRVRWRYSYLTKTAQEIPDMLKRDLQAGQRRENQWRQILGIVPGGGEGRIIACGKSLVAVDIESGLKVWQTPRSAFGRGLLAGDQILVPGRTSIEICSQQTGELVRSIPLKTADTDQQGGNLTIANGMLLVAQASRLAAYSEFSQLKERIERELTLHPGKSSLLIQLGELEALEGDRNAAEHAFQRILDSVDHDQPNFLLARKKLARLWQDAGKLAFEASRFEEARDYWERSLPLTDDPTKQLELTFGLARIAADRPEDALERLQSVLDDERLASLPVGGMPARQEATVQMTCIIQEHGRDPYQQIESRAAEQLDGFQQDATADDLKRFIQRFPHSKSVLVARQQLARAYRASGKISEAYAVLEEMRRHGDIPSVIQATLDLIELFETIGNGRGANRLWESLAKFDTSIDVQRGAVTQSLSQFISLRTKTVDETPQPAPVRLQRSWTYPLSDDARVVIPEMPPGSSAFSAVLISTKADPASGSWLWRCVETNTGKTRWEETATEPIEQARWTPVHLLIGTSTNWQARAADSGRSIWSQTFPSRESTAVFTQGLIETGEETLWPTVVDGDRGVFFFDPNDGHLISRIKPPARIHGRFAIGGRQNLGFAAWEVSGSTEPDNLDNPELRSGSRTDPSIVAFFQTSKPTRTWMATCTSIRNPWSIREIAGVSTGWLATPFGIESRLCGITQEHQLEVVEIGGESDATRVSTTATKEPGSSPDAGIVEFLRRPRGNGQVVGLDDLSNSQIIRRLSTKPDDSVLGNGSPQRRWIYRNFAMGQADPFAWVQRGNLLVAVDGSRLISFDSVNGRKKWVVGIAAYPIQSPPAQICTFGETIYATSQGLLRGIDCQTGQPRFQRFLGNTAPQWQTTIAWKPAQHIVQNSTAVAPGSTPDVGRLAIWPTGLPSGQANMIFLCDSWTGEIIQRFSVDSEPRTMTLNSDGRGLLWTRKSLTGLTSRE